jgi:hypothetical protein
VSASIACRACEHDRINDKDYASAKERVVPAFLFVIVLDVIGLGGTPSREVIAGRPAKVTALD